MNKRKIVRQIWILGILLLTAWQAEAQVFSKTKVKNTNISYLELLQLIFPDVDENGAATQTVKIRSAIETDEAYAYQEKMEVEVVREEWINSEDGQRLMLIIKAAPSGQTAFEWGELNLLALYSSDKKPRLLDVIEVSADRENSFREKLEISPKMSLTVIQSSHHNAGENYLVFSFFYVKKDKFIRTLEEFPDLYYGRGYESEIKETGKFSTLSNAKTNFRDIVFKIKVESKKFGKDCEKLKAKMSKNFTLRAIWQNGKFKFADGGAALKSLRREKRKLGFEN